MTDMSNTDEHERRGSVRLTLTADRYFEQSARATPLGRDPFDMSIAHIEGW